MSDHGPLIVPIVVEAFVVNDHVRQGGGNAFYRGEMHYNSLKYPANGKLESNNNFSQGASRIAQRCISEMAVAGFVHERAAGQRRGCYHVSPGPEPLARRSV